jgi:hypothetical protein
MASNNWKNIKRFLSEMPHFEEHDSDLVGIQQLVDLQNFSRSQGVLVSRDPDFVGLEILTISSAFSQVSDVTSDEIFEHQSFQEQPFGLNSINGYWFITTAMPLANLDMDDFVSVLFKVAWVADILEQVHVGGDEY